MRLFRSSKKIEDPSAGKIASPPAESEPAELKKSPAVSGLKPGRAIDWRVLFVGGDAAWFERIERDTLCLQPDWVCHRAGNSAEADAAIGAASFDAVVFDDRVAGASEVVVRAMVKGRRSLYVVRSDGSNSGSMTNWERLGITPVSVEADAASLVTTLKRAERLRTWMADPALKKLLPLLRKLPAEPRLYAQVSQELQSTDGSVLVIANLIAQDPVMSAKILQVVNSAFFGLSYEVNDTAEAVIVLGTERIRSLILLAGVFSQYDSVMVPGYSPDQIWRHSLQVGSFARTIAMAETKNGRVAESAFTAGLLHDLGKLVLAGNLPEKCDEVRHIQTTEKISQCAAEMKVLGTTHAELGACLLGTWGLPLPILEAIACHHRPAQSDEKGLSLLAVVHAANVFAGENGQGSGGDSAPAQVDLQFLTRSQLGDCRDRWRECCGLPTTT